MATLYVTECAQTGVAANQWVMSPAVQTILADYNIAIGAASTNGPTFQNGTTFVMINADSACSLAFGVSPVAVPTAHRMSPNDTRFYIVQPGWKVAVIENT